VRLERQYREGSALAMGDAFRLGDHRAVAEMDAIEVADRNHGAARILGHVAPVSDDAYQRALFLCRPQGGPGAAQRIGVRPPNGQPLTRSLTRGGLGA
jgi:hypothetical protein